MSRLTASPRKGSAAAILFVAADTQRFLLARRADSGCDYPGTWCGIGGGQDPGESPEETAIREAFEETGFNGDVDLRYIGKEDEPGFTLYHFVGIVDSEFEPALNDEHTAAKWMINLDDVPQGHEVHPGTIRLLRFIQDQYQ